MAQPSSSHKICSLFPKIRNHAHAAPLVTVSSRHHLLRRKGGVNGCEDLSLLALQQEESIIVSHKVRQVPHLNFSMHALFSFRLRKQERLLNKADQKVKQHTARMEKPINKSLHKIKNNLKKKRNINEEFKRRTKSSDIKAVSSPSKSDSCKHTTILANHLVPFSSHLCLPFLTDG